jgi:hypothetical protein
MKYFFGFLVIILVACVGLFLCSADVISTPDLKGNWTGTSVGHYAIDGYVGEGTYSYDLVIKEQNGRVVNGTLYERGIKENNEYNFSGIIAHDMKTLNVVEYGTGLDIGYLISDKEMELILQVNEVDGLAELCTLQKMN